ncbi:unnamed protein product [Macrosiphum euphorbiae]|uniref:Uncharacterized protein n=1 Tax=Macrosiphum euphorbiae TaxID=13131 RepID=A0AAV0VXG1_9HEMI|nr:unnamed protein product [Macrosiphum euphorbiae]
MKKMMFCQSYKMDIQMITIQMFQKKIVFGLKNHQQLILKQLQLTTQCITKVKRHEERSAKAFSILEVMHNDKKSRHAKLEKEKRTIG